MLEVHCVPVRQIRKAVNSTRLVDVVYQPAVEEQPAVMTIDETRYTVEESIFDAEFGVGRAFNLVKLDPKAPEQYSVFVSTNPEGVGDHCDCLGFAKGEYCKHCDVLRHLITRAIIDDPRSGEWEEPEVDDDGFWEQLAQEEADAEALEDTELDAEYCPEWEFDDEYADCTPFCE